MDFTSGQKNSAYENSAPRYTANASKTAPRILLPEYHPDDEREYENDREYLMQMYPAKARIVMAMIEKECDRLEYEESPMYARYPDKETLLFIASGVAGRICGDVRDSELEQLIQVLFLNECYDRRNKHRRRRKFY
jgi:pyruvate/2-oxoacid:ferredoxin oxidoreductase alpha subunit